MFDFDVVTDKPERKPAPETKRPTPPPALPPAGTRPTELVTVAAALSSKGGESQSQP